MNVTIDCCRIQTREALFRQFSQALPGLYGQNLDALHDCLTALTGTVRLESWAEAEEQLGPWGQRVKKVLLLCALENESLELIL